MSTNNDTTTMAIFGNTKKNTSFSKKLDLVCELNHGIIVEVVTPEQATLAESAGAKAVFMIDPFTSPMLHQSLIKRTKEAVKIPVMDKFRIGHLAEAKDLESNGLVNIIEESTFSGVGKAYIDKHAINVPVVCRGQLFEEALKRVTEGATLFRIQGGGSKGTNPVRFMDTVKWVRAMMRRFKKVANLPDDNEVCQFASELQVPYDLVLKIKELHKFPVPLFAAGGIVTPADVMLMMNLGCDGVFVDNQVFKRGNKFQVLKQMVEVAANVDNRDGLINLMLG